MSFSHHAVKYCSLGPGHGTCIHPNLGGSEDLWTMLQETRTPVEVFSLHENSFAQHWSRCAWPATSPATRCQVRKSTRPGFTRAAGSPSSSALMTKGSSLAHCLVIWNQKTNVLAKLHFFRRVPVSSINLLMGQERAFFLKQVIILPQWFQYEKPYVRALGKQRQTSTTL